MPQFFQLYMMEHLATSSSYQGDIPKVPLLLGCEYDGLDFANYPSRMGFDKVALMEGRFSQREPAYTASFLQAWLFFGLLTSVAGNDVAVPDMICTDGSGNRVITTDALPDFLQRLATSYPGFPKARQQRIWQCLEDASTFSRNFSGWEKEPNRCPVPPEVSLSIMALGSSLNVTLYHASKGEKSKLPMWFWGTSSLLTSSMAKQGWCPNDLHRLAEYQSTPLMFFASTVSRPAHQEMSHNTCTPEGCLSHQINDETYRTKHVKKCGGCKLIQVRSQKSGSWLESGHFPIVTIKPTRSGNDYQVQMSKSSSNVPFLAISHVWSDGLGNLQDNALPLCQIVRLYELAKTVMSSKDSNIWAKPDVSTNSNIPVSIWIDTICIPRQQPFRKIAISLIAKTFSLAKYVLVLDSELQSLHSSRGITELLVHVAVSGWMRRVWTLLEGSIGQRQLWVQFHDAALCLRKTIQGIQEDTKVSQFQLSTLPVDAMAFYESLNISSKAYSSSWSPATSWAFTYILRGLAGRTTSWKGDDILCFGILLGLKPLAVQDLYDTPVEGRLEKLYTLVSHVPRGIIFSPGIKCGTPGLRWAAADFRDLRPYLHFNPGKIYPRDGLEVCFPGFILSGFQLPDHGFQFLDSYSDTWWRATYRQRPSDGFLANIKHVPGRTELGVICSTTKFEKASARDLMSVPGALVSILKQTSSTKNVLEVGHTAVYCVFISNLQLSKPENAKADLERFPFIQAKRAPVFVGERMRTALGLNFLANARQEYLDQTWYIS